MSETPDGLMYTEEHEYLKDLSEEDEPGIFQVGITDYAQGELGDVVFVELPVPGDEFAAQEPFGTIEAVKAVSDLYCPVAGEVVGVNDALDDEPALVNSDPYGEGWMVKVRAKDVGEVEKLMDAATYAAHIAEAE